MVQGSLPLVGSESDHNSFAEIESAWLFVRVQCLAKETCVHSAELPVVFYQEHQTFICTKAINDLVANSYPLGNHMGTACKCPSNGIDLALAVQPTTMASARRLVIPHVHQMTPTLHR